MTLKDGFLSGPKKINTPQFCLRSLAGCATEMSSKGERLRCTAFFLHSRRERSGLADACESHYSEIDAGKTPALPRALKRINSLLRSAL
jgi:hypothetical protein